MSFVKLKDGRSTYALDSIRLRNKRDTKIAPQANTVELYMKDGILYQIDDKGVQQQIGIPSVTTIQRNSLSIEGLIVYDIDEGKHFGYGIDGWHALYG